MVYWLILSFGVAFTILLVLVGDALFGAPFVPTPMPIVRKTLELVELKPDETLYDLGSGDGRVLITAAQEFGARAVGVEHNPVLVLVSRWKVRRLGLDDRIQIVRMDLFKIDFCQADVVSMFLLQDINDELRPKLERELRPGAKVISYKYPITGWEPITADYPNSIYIYRV